MDDPESQNRRDIANFCLIPVSSTYIHSVGCIGMTARLKSTFDAVFSDIPLVHPPLLLPRKGVEERVDPATGREVYYTGKDRIVRYDLTNPLLSCTHGLPATRAFGPVARNGPTAGYRWKEFHQYDIDADYDTYGISLLRRGLEVLMAVYSRGLVMRCTGFSEEELVDWPVPVIRESIEKSHTYYTSHKFEVCPVDHPGVAVLSGGCYVNDGVRKIGYTLGVTRIACLMEKAGLKLPLVPSLLCYVRQGSPVALIEAFGGKGLCVIAVRAKKTLAKDYPAIQRRMATWGYRPLAIVIHGSRQEQQGLYYYRAPGQPVARCYTPARLLEYLEGKMKTF